MKRRTFLTNLAATAALPMVPLKSLAAAAPTAAAASIEQPYLWASFITRVHNNASPSMLQRLLKLDESVAKQVYSELIKNNVVTSPNAYGISRAVNPYPQPGLAHMQGQFSSQAVKTSDKSLKLNTSDTETETDPDSPARAASALLPSTACSQNTAPPPPRLTPCPKLHGTLASKTTPHSPTKPPMRLKLIAHADPTYPEALRHIPDPPPLLWTMGDLSLLNRPAIAIVGARNASSLGVRMTRKLVTDLGAEGITVVSGLARGIDAAAHTAALTTGTIAVQAGGVDVVYPRENATLHDDIATQGLRLSENPLGLIPQARHFPQRNRIIAGLAQATLVVEGALRSGSLITARDSAELGREVMAVPGSPMDPRAAGCNALIRDGATLIRSAQDVIDSLPKPVQPHIDTPQQPTLPFTPPDQITATILNLLGPTAVAEDSLIRDVGLPAAEITPHLTALELEGKILRQPGGMLALAG